MCNGDRKKMRAHRLRLSVFLLWLCFSGFVFGATYRPMDGSPFPIIDGPGPVQTSQNYTLEIPVALHSAKTKLAVDAPKGALLAVMSQEASLVATVGDVALPVFNNRGLEASPHAGEIFHLSTLVSGTHALRLEGFKASTQVKLLVAQPDSPLLLKAQVKPLAVQAGQRLQVLIECTDERPIRFAEVSVGLNGRSYPAIDRGNQHYTATLLAPSVNARESIPIRVVANGVRFNKQPFVREVTTRVMVIQSKSGLKKVLANPAGDIEVEVLPAQGNFRLQVLYGYKNKTIALAEERIILADTNSKTTFAVARPDMARAANKALVKWLNMDTLGLEGQKILALTPDPEALATFKMPTPVVPTLPENKRKVLELLEYTPAPAQ